MCQIYRPGKILQRRELRGQPFRGRHPKIPGLCVCVSTLLCSESNETADTGPIRFLGVRVEDAGVPGLPQPNTEPGDWIGSAGRLAALCLLCDRGEISGAFNC